MTERLRLSLAVPCSHIAMSKVGLVVSSEESKTHWVISPETLVVTRKITVPTRVLATSPSLKYAYVTHVRMPRAARPVSVPLARLNLLTGWLSAAKWVDPKGWPRSAAQHARQPVITPDGKYAVTTNSSNSLFRYRGDGEAQCQ